MTTCRTGTPSTRSLADDLHCARTSVRATTQAVGTLSIEEGYSVQRSLIELRLQEGELLAGLKLGFTSRAKMAQMGVSEVIVGVLTDAMQIPDGEALAASSLIHPRVEPEIAFRVGSDVDLANPGTSLVDAVDAVAPALEIIDSRYADFKFDLASVIADNTSASAFAVGPWQPVPQDISNLGVRLEIDGAPAQFGSTAAILGDPWRSLTALAHIGRRVGYRVNAGDVILAGAATAAIPLAKSTVAVRVTGLGRVVVRVV